MKHLTKIISIILILSTVLTINIQPAESKGFGVGPNYIHLDNALKNATYKNTLHIYNENVYDTNVFLEVAGEPSEWIKFYQFNAECCPISSILVHNQSTKQVLCKIVIPEYAANKLYNATIYTNFNSTETEADGNVSIVDISLPIEVAINVTGDQDYNVSIRLLEVKDVEINYPLIFRVQFENIGNVYASPRVDITITKDGNYIDKIQSMTGSIKPLNLYAHKIQWDTIGKVAGRYNAHIKIYEGTTTLRETNLTFQLFPPGALGRNGALKGITYEGELEKGKMIKLDATFINEGEIDLETQFFGEIYKDDQLIGTIDSPVTVVSKYKTHHFISYLKIEENGEYLVKGYVLYGGIPTETKQLKFTVGAFLSNLTNLLLLFVFIILIGAAVFIYIKRKRRKTATPNALDFDTRKTVKRIRFRRRLPKLSRADTRKEKIPEDKPVLTWNEKKLRVKKKKVKPEAVGLESMSAKEIEDYVRSL